MKLKKFGSFLLVGFLSLTSISSTLFGSEPKSEMSNPIYVNYILDKVEDDLEKNADKQYAVDWDFEISYLDGKVMVLIEYDQKDAAAFKKISKEELEQLLTTISEKITSAVKQNVEINGVIVEDDSTKPSLTFMYKDGKLVIK